MLGNFFDRLGRKRKNDAEVVDDPWFWSAQQLEDAIFKSLNNLGPNSTSEIKQALQQQQIKGAAFLLQTTDSSLTNSWKLSDPRVRSSILQVRDSLRKISPACSQILPASATQINGDSASTKPTEAGHVREEQSGAGAPLHDGPPAETTRIPDVRSNETYVTDAQGRKRRKLAILGTTVLTGSSHVAFGQDAGTNLPSTNFTSGSGNDEDGDDSAEDADDESTDNESEGPYAGLAERWDAKYGEDELPIYGDSDFDEDELSDACYAELEQDLDEEIPQPDHLTQEIVLPKHLTVDQAHIIIGEEIQKFEDEWVQHKKPLLDSKAWQSWSKFKTEEERRRAIAADKDVLQNLKDRQKDVVQALTDDLSVNDADLRKLCGTLEETIKERHTRKHHIDVLQLSRPPAKPAATPKIRKKTVRQPVPVDGEIELSSSDDEFIDDGDEEMRQTDVNLVNPRTTSSQLDYDLEMTDAQLVRPEVPDPSSEDEFEFEDHNFGVEPPHIEVRNLWEARAKSLSATPLQDPDPVIRRWDLEMLEWNRDGQRIIMMLLWRAPGAPESNLMDTLNWLRDLEDKSRAALFDELVLTLEAFKDKEDQIFDYTPQHFAYLRTLAKLFMCFHYNSSRPMRISEDELFNLAKTVAGAHKRLSLPILHLIDQDQQLIHTSFSTFLDFVNQAWSIHEQREQQAQLESQEMIVISSDDNDDSGDENSASDVAENGPELSLAILPRKDSEPVPITKFLAASRTTIAVDRALPAQRKRPVHQNQTAAEKRKKANQRYEELQSRSHAALTSKELQTEHKAGHVCINPGKSEEDSFIFINEHLSQHLQTHQIEGIRFMWTQVTEQDDNNALRGCLLAHSMGLGKTLQALTLLATLAEASHVSAPSAQRNQIPEGLRETRALILVPAGLVNNWEAEFKKWITPTTLAYKAIGDIQVCKSGELKSIQRDTIVHWFEHGGILLVGHEGFRTWVNMKDPLKETKHTEHLRKCLTEGPNLVIIDESHKIKNSTTLLRKCVDMIKTPVRIAMTGSPLSNNLGEYYQILDWVCPGYLGGQVEFDAYYVEPINRGSFVESTSSEKKTALQRVKELEFETRPKVHKRDREVLNEKLKSKTEFIITVPLTALQKGIYNRYAEFVNEFAGRQGVKHTNLLTWMDIMGRICSHPEVFTMTDLWQQVKQLATSPNPRDLVEQLASLNQVLDEDESRNVLDNTSIKYRDEILALYRDIEQVISGVQDLGDVKHSFRTSLLLQILEEALQVGDQILVFTHSLKMLDWLEQLLRDRGFPALVISGKTPVPQRVELIDAFNRGSHRIAALSTKAGALGFNITGANRAVLLDFSFNPQWEIQAASRVWRLGQEKAVFIYRLLAGGTFEERFFNDAVFKTQLAGKVVKDKNLENMAAREKMRFGHALDVPQSDVIEQLGKDVILDSIIQQHINEEDRGLRAIRTTDVLETERTGDWTEEDQRLLLEHIEKRRAENARLKAISIAQVQDVSATASTMTQVSTHVANGQTSLQVEQPQSAVLSNAIQQEVIDLSSEPDTPVMLTAPVAPMMVVQPYRPSIIAHTRNPSISSRSASDIEVIAPKPAQHADLAPDAKASLRIELSSDISEHEQNAQAKHQHTQAKKPKFQPNAAKAGGRKPLIIDLASDEPMSQGPVSAPTISTLPPKPSPASTQPPNLPQQSDPSAFISLNIPGSYPYDDPRMHPARQASIRAESAQIPTGPKADRENTQPFRSRYQDKRAQSARPPPQDGRRDSRKVHSKDGKGQSLNALDRHRSTSSRRDVIPRDDVRDVLSEELQKRFCGPSHQQRDKNSGHDRNI